jgi:hypothetical protein
MSPITGTDPLTRISSDRVRTPTTSASTGISRTRNSAPTRGTPVSSGQEPPEQHGVGAILGITARLVAHLEDRGAVGGGDAGHGDGAVDVPVGPPQRGHGDAEAEGHGVIVRNGRDFRPFPLADRRTDDRWWR